MKKYLFLFASHFSVALEYRSNLVGIFILELVSISSMIILWAAVYKAQQSVAGYSFYEAIIYFVLIPMVGFITSVDISEKLSKEIRMGTFSNYLLRPYTFWLAAFMETLAVKINYLILVFPVVVSIMTFLVMKGYLVLTLDGLFSGLLVATLAFLLHFVLDLLIACWAFWTDSVWAFKHVKIILFSVLGGVSFPLDFLSGWFGALARMLPFQYFYYVPVSYVLGRSTGIKSIVSDCIYAGLWIVALIILSVFAWKMGLKKYDAYGR